MTTPSATPRHRGCDNPPTDQEGRSIDIVNVVLVGLGQDLGEELSSDEAFEVRNSEDLEGLDADASVDAVVVALGDQAPLELLGSLRARAPDAAILVVTDADREADGAVALHGGAEDHLVRGSIPPGLFPRAVRYAVAQRRLRRDLATTDELTGLPNLRGFAPIADHHLRMADRAKTPVVFLFVRLDGLAEAAKDGPELAARMAREAAEVLLEAVRDSDVPARISSDTFAVLLTGDAVGAETLVLSRLVEAIAVHNTTRDDATTLSLSVGSALYEPEQPATLAQILETAGRRLREQPALGSSDS
ncbi:MAG TPA: GGDEF domain-containing protein [Actinomycetota bacterium]